jgi:hypothetical protein
MEENKIIFYSSKDGDVKVEIHYEEETFWLTQKKLAALFDVKVNTINYHLKEIFKVEELDEKAVSRKSRITADDGKSYLTNFYNVDAIIAIGYRVNGFQATQFRIWATQTLKDFIIKGFVLDDERMKQGKFLGKDYFDELLERIRDIRASERRFYQKITDLYAEASIDYNSKAPITQQFYQTVQNKLHWAITGQTAAEIIAARANSQQPNMGLKTWKKSPKGKIRKQDTTVAKNYLQKDEIVGLNQVVSMYLDYAENQAQRQIAMKMTDWIKKLDAFLQFNEYELLNHAGKVSTAIAKKLAHQEYDKYKFIQDRLYESDFDKVLKVTKSKKNNTAKGD